ncbi:alpha-1,2-fucosyltransferase [Priestia megaterium]|uniref:alpha-1,2-fucosyltransferase n=1 Tax=Priestia megaterium TaxID=1404 RepID=UPI000BF290A4|nr:alpha-1,2-fucosyltransferase [Priestia megaterium]PFK78941.1 alpha-1,2-fucosyltransferase [Priestia megaterium]
MKIVQISSGLGNQLFQYALYKRLSMNNNDVFLDVETSYQLNKNQHNGYEIERIFSIQPSHATKGMIDELADVDNRLINRLRRKLFGPKNSMYTETKEFSYDCEVFTKDGIYIKGYWQNYNYFKEIEDDLKNELVFKKALDLKNSHLINQMNKEISVSIHVRRGDYYLNKEYENKFGNIADLDYYLKAINFIKKEVDDPKFYVFSDDIKWAKENLNLTDNVTYVEHNKGSDSYKDMRLMTCCKHNIIANSTFSWWGAFLNENKNKIVIAPGKWINVEGVGGINLFPEGWIVY